jgi:succinate dehydrogenase / fumarate reductase, cytochrome b subunit
MSETPSAANRPLSPHLQIYWPRGNMFMSIVHRITGVALYAGSALLALWLISAAFSPDAFAAVNWLLASWFGRLVLLGFTWAVLHHLIGGLRHLVWDTGAGFELPTINLMSWGSLVLSLLLTVLVWVAALLA